MPPRKASKATTRKPATKQTTKRPKQAPRTAIKEAAPISEEQRQAKLTAYTALKSADLPIPSELEAEVKRWIEAEEKRRETEEAERQKRQAALDKENQKGPWYVRNGYPAPFNLRLDRQTEKRRIELKPRGEPGDLHPLQKDDLEDPNLKRNVAIGIIEIIPAGEANRIIEHQTHNSGRRVHTPTALLRNPVGEPYAEGAIKTEIEFNEQGVTVGVIDPNQMQGHVPDKEVGGTRSFGGVQRVHPGQPGQREVASGFVPNPHQGGNPAIIQYGPVQDRDAQAKIADDIARRTGVQGRPEDVMGLNVVVEPTQHE